MMALVLAATTVALPRCGLIPRASDKVSDQIGALAEADVLTEAEVAAAEEAYEALSEEEKEEVENAGLLEEARARLEEQRERARMSDARRAYVGEWGDLDSALGLFQPIVYWFGPLTLKADGTGSSEGTEWTWEASEAGSQILLSGVRGRTALDIVRDGAFVKLVEPKGQYVLLRSGDLDSYIGARFLRVKVTPDNVRDIMGLPVCGGDILDEKKKFTGNDAWFLPSRKIAEGFVYYGRSEDFFCSLVVNGQTADPLILAYPFDSLAYPPYTQFAWGSSAGGTLVFIRSAFVQENRMVDGRTRSLTLTDGTRHTTSQNWYTEVVGYEGWEY